MARILSEQGQFAQAGEPRSSEKGDQMEDCAKRITDDRREEWLQ